MVMKVAIVTGAAGGIGLATARCLGREGMAVALLDREEDRIRQAAEILAGDGIDAKGFACDVSDVEAVDHVFRLIEGWHAAVAVLVNNAGIHQTQNSRNLQPEQWQMVIDVNLGGMFNCIRSVVDPMTRHGGGAIVNIASIAGMIAVPGRAAYNAAKHGVVGLTRSFAGDLAPLGIRVNAVAPGMIETPMTARYVKDPAFLAALSDSVALGRPGQPEEIAEAVAFLASGKASYITGAVLPVDGGFTAVKTFVPSSRTAFDPA